MKGLTPSEKELDRALQETLQLSESFRSWFLAQLTRGAGHSRLLLCRSNYPWGKVRLILPNAETGALEGVDREGETDVLAVFENSSGQRLGVHVENKLHSGAFTEYQAEVYAARAEQWVGRDAYGAYHYWETVLLAPQAFIEHHLGEAKKFTTRIAHERVAPFIPIFGPTPDPRLQL